MLTMVLATLLVVPALARPAARMWAIVFVAALALWLGLWTLPALWPGQRWLGERWNWSGSLLALSGTLWVGTILVRRGGLTWHEMGFTWAQQPDSILPALGVASAALLMQGLLTISSGYAPGPVSPETLRCPRGFVARSFRVRSTRDGDRNDEEAIQRGTDHWLPA
ncbi:MAG: hypothetical protein ACXW14_13175 [Burkholderiaceae bacterium]